FDGKKLSFPDREELLIKIGQGAQNAASMFIHLDLLKERINREKPAAPELISKTAGATAMPRNPTVQIEGDMRMPVMFAKCCKPNENGSKEIAGVIVRGGEVRVHDANCSMLKNVNPERRLKVWWVEKGK
ncbi:MAG TPA: hypothetical protein VHA78_04370, partial [Candidatus Peribacteraceae bacterium]|nr:hypothetical protein [Candidatus Peribacteraceae bacterium]